MRHLPILRSDLEALNDLVWFDTMCRILIRAQNPTTKLLTQIIGTEDTRFSKENRGSKFLLPFDKRFKSACINPDLSEEDLDQPLDYLSFGGIDFNLKMIDIIQRFPDYKIQRNTYDGGTQIFFYPVAKEFEFTALSFRVHKEPEDIQDINSLVFHHVGFKFGEKMVVGRDGYHMRR